MRDLKPIVAAFERGAAAAVLATAVRTRGSTYRKAGARLLVGADGATTGSLSSGCLEDEVAGIARRVLRTGVAELHEFDLRPRFGCNGSIEILLERLAVGNVFVSAVRGALDSRRALRVATRFAGAESLGSFVPGTGFRGDDAIFSQTLEPVIQLVLVGDGHDAIALHRVAAAIGWDVEVVDQAAAIPVLDSRSAVVVKAHKLGRDFAALRALLAQAIPYVGLMGPVRRKRELLTMLYEEGALSPNASLTHLFGPSGLDLGSETPAEIALSICAEIQAVMAGHAAGSLRDKPAAIHLPTRELAPEPIP